MPLGLNIALSTACFEAFRARIIYEMNYCLNSAKQQYESILLDSAIVRDMDSYGAKQESVSRMLGYRE